MQRKLLAAVFFSACSAMGYAQDTVTLKVAHLWPPTALGHKKVLLPWCDKIARESNNRLKCQIYPAMQLGGTPPQLIQQAVDGVADIVWTLPGYTAGRFVGMEVMELPFFTKDAEGSSRAAWYVYENFASKEFAGLKPLAFHVHDRGQIHNNKRPIASLADFRGLKLRVPTRSASRIVSALGATPVSMPLPAVADAVSKGVVDGYLLPWEVVPTMKLQEITKYHSEISPPQPGLYTAVFTFAMNQAKYNSLPPELKKVIDANSGADFSAAIGKVWDASAPEARNTAIEHKNQFNTLSAKAVADMIKATAEAEDAWAKEAAEKGYDSKALLESARTWIQKYSK